MPQDEMQRALRTPTYQAGKGSDDRSTFKPSYRRGYDGIKWSPRETCANGTPKPRRTRKKYL